MCLVNGISLDRNLFVIGKGVSLIPNTIILKLIATLYYSPFLAWKAGTVYDDIYGLYLTTGKPLGGRTCDNILRYESPI
jgi:hypothetical protein